MKKLLSMLLVLLLMVAPMSAGAISLRDIVNNNSSNQQATSSSLPVIDGLAVPDLAPFVGADSIISGDYTYSHTPVSADEEITYNAVGYPCAGSYDGVINSLIDYSEYAEEYGYSLVDAQVEENRILLEFQHSDGSHYMLDWDGAYDADNVYLYFPLQAKMNIEHSVEPTYILNLGDYLGTGDPIRTSVYQYTSSKVTVDGYIFENPSSESALISALKSYVSAMEDMGFTAEYNEDDGYYFAILTAPNGARVYVDWDEEYASGETYFGLEKNMNLVPMVQSASNNASSGSTSSSSTTPSIPSVNPFNIATPGNTSVTSILMPALQDYLNTGAPSGPDTQRDEENGVTFDVYTFSNPDSSFYLDTAVMRYVADMQDNGFELVAEEDLGNAVAYVFEYDGSANDAVSILFVYEDECTLFLQQGSGLYF